jgi:hypothetical protein
MAKGTKQLRIREDTYLAYRPSPRPTFSAPGSAFESHQIRPIPAKSGPKIKISFLRLYSPPLTPVKSPEFVFIRDHPCLKPSHPFVIHSPASIQKPFQAIPTYSGYRLCPLPFPRTTRSHTTTVAPSRTRLQRGLKRDQPPSIFSRRAFDLRHSPPDPRPSTFDPRLSAWPHTFVRKYSIVFAMPSARRTFGSHFKIFFAFVMSGLRCFGSSCGKGL